LHLIDDDGRRMTAKKALWFLLGLRSFRWQVKRDKPMVREEPSQRGGFARLASAREYNDRPGARGAL
jgi:hypothetical protein